MTTAAISEPGLFIYIVNICAAVLPPASGFQYAKGLPVIRLPKVPLPQIFVEIAARLWYNAAILRQRLPAGGADAAAPIKGKSVPP